ncbi:amidohydrolase [Ahniella affigens]|uniref:Amidohydrolase n=1 Tax=Ahniella affigens TaxID=2021234 RepID=A0A2P1PXJ1_9GAMM|nr:amidohydrolase [Ahniella affigens]AVP99568.1 amidohydrolase [Ahniella affigens]
MRHRLLLLSILVYATGFGAMAADSVPGQIESVRQTVIDWRRDFHQHPELGNHEIRTSGIVAAELKKMGIRVETGIAKTGVVGVLTGDLPGPRIAIRADMDALPVVEEVDLPFASKAKADWDGKEVGVMHACGHDAHTAILLGTAKVLSELKAQLRGEVLFVFQPAEEGPPAGQEGGAELMMKEGVFKGREPEAVFGLHVFYTLHSDQIGVREGPLLAGSDRFSITVKGQQTHGAQPWRGVDPVVTAAQIVNQSQTIISRQLNISELPAVLSFGMVHGGLRWNIIPEQVTLEGTIRTFDPAMRDDLFKRLIRTAEHVAAAQGASVDYVIPMPDAVNLVTYNNPDLTRAMRPSLEAAVGADRVKSIPPNMVAEDFPRFTQAIPGMYFFVGAVKPGADLALAAPNHSPRFTVDEGALDTGVRAMVQLALDAGSRLAK